MYTSKDVQNEVLQIMAWQVLQEIATRIKSAGWYTVMADKVTDCGNDEQFIVCVRYVDKDSLAVNEDFIGISGRQHSFQNLSCCSQRCPCTHGTKT